MCWLRQKLVFPGGASGKEPPWQCRRQKRRGSNPGSGRSAGGGCGNPLQYSCLENPWTEEPDRLQSMGSPSDTPEATQPTQVKNINSKGVKGKEIVKRKEQRTIKKGLSLWDSPPCPLGLRREPWSLWEQENRRALEIYYGQDTHFFPLPTDSQNFEKIT